MITHMNTTLEHTHPDVHTDLAAVGQRYRRDGFVNAGPLLDHDELTVLRRELDRVIAEQASPGVPQPYRLSNMGREGTVLWQIVNIWQASAAFAALLRKPRLHAVLAAATGERSLRLWHDQVQYKPAGNGGINWWHQDAPYWPPLTPADGLHTAWIALDDVEEDNGCMSMVPGSHRWGDAITTLEALTDYDQLPTHHAGHAVARQRCPVRAGHVHLHHALTWHGSHANRSGRPRRAVALHVMGESVRRRSGQHLLSPELTMAIGEPIEGPLFPLVYRQH